MISLAKLGIPLESNLYRNSMTSLSSHQPQLLKNNILNTAIVSENKLYNKANLENFSLHKSNKFILSTLTSFKPHKITDIHNAAVSFLHSSFGKTNVLSHIKKYKHGSALHDLLCKGVNTKTDIEKLKDIVQNETDINRVNQFEHSPIYYAIHYNKHQPHLPEIVDLLLTNGVKINNDEFQYGSLLHDIIHYKCSKENKINIIHVLKKHGIEISIDIRIDDRCGHSSLYCAQHNSSNQSFSKELERELKEYGAKLNFAEYCTENYFKEHKDPIKI